MAEFFSGVNLKKHREKIGKPISVKSDIENGICSKILSFY